MLVPDWIFIRYASHLSFPLNSNSYPQMKHKFYNDGNMKPVCWRCSGEVYNTTLSPSRKVIVTLATSKEVVDTLLLQQPTAHLTPVPFIQKHARNIFTMYRTAINRPANKCVYKYILFVYTGPMKRRGNRNYRNGDLTKDVSTWSSTYIKTLD